MRSFSAMISGIAIIIMATLFISGCTKKPEEIGDKYFKLSEMTDNPRAKEEREKKAYLKYLEAVNLYNNRKEPLPKGLKERMLTLTLKRLNRELARFQEAPEEANPQQIQLWRDDFNKYLPGLNNAEIVEGYSRFLLAFADPKFMELPDVMAVLEEVKALKVQAAAAQEKIAQLNASFAADMVKEINEMITKGKDALAKKNPAAKEELVFAEYKVQLALKRDPNNAQAKQALRWLRETLLDTYSGYERFGENLDPEIDKYDIYLCIPKIKSAGKKLNMDVALWNLSANPLNVQRDNFLLVTNTDDTLTADPATKFNKILVDVKRDTTQLVVFNISGKEKIRNLLFRDGRKISEKFFR